MVEKIKNPKNVAIITLITCLISIVYTLFLSKLYSITDDLSYFFPYGLKYIFMTSSLTILIYLGLILLKKKKVNLSLLNKITIVQLLIIIFILIKDYRIFDFSYIVIGNIGYLLLVITVTLNLILLEFNKKINIKLFAIIECILFLIDMCPFTYVSLYHGIIENFPEQLIIHIFYIPFIYYLYLYGRSKTRKELKK